jgi:hypothetical protein
LSDQIKDDVQKAGVAEVPEINVLIEHMSSYIINSRSDNTAGSFLLHITCTHLILYIIEFIVLCVAPESSKCVIKRAICTD